MSDQPTPGLTAQQQTVQYTVSADLVPSGDGTPVIQLVIGLNGLMQVAAVIPEAIVEQFGDLVQEQLRAAAGKLRQAKLGIVLPGAEPVKFSPINGRQM